MADAIQLTDLDTITRYSIAVRKATADRDELIEALRADLAWLERGQRHTRVAALPESDVDAGPEAEDDEAAADPAPPRAPIRRMPAKVSAPRKTAKKAPAKTVPTKKATPRRGR
jgi:hypothetical protein